MIGSAVVSLPWAFQQAGLMLGLIIAFTSFMVSFYTCSLIIRMAQSDSDYSETLKKYYGKVGYYTGIFTPACIIIGALSVYFVIMT